VVHDLWKWQEEGSGERLEARNPVFLGADGRLEPWKLRIHCGLSDSNLSDQGSGDFPVAAGGEEFRDLGQAGHARPRPQDSSGI